MIKEVLKKSIVTKVMADGAYDSRSNIRFLSDSSIEPPKDEEPTYKSRGCMPRKLSVIEQKEDLDAWEGNHE